MNATFGQGEGGDGGKFLPGLITEEALAATHAETAQTAGPASDYDGNLDGQNEHRDAPGIPPAPLRDAPGARWQNPPERSNGEACGAEAALLNQTTQPEEKTDAT
ncbi:MAG: hypothetical protein ACKV19_26260 [Verrucomicrobiales bacterium]